MLRFYTGVLTQDEMGVADLIIKTTSILYPVVSLSIGQAVIRYGLERRRRKPDVFTIGLLTVACGFLISLPFNPLLKLVHYNTSAGVAGSLLDYRILIYVYVLTSCTQNVCGQFIRAIGYVRLYAIDGIFRTFMTIVLNILYLKKVFRWNILRLRGFYYLLGRSFDRVPVYDRQTLEIFPSAAHQLLSVAQHAAVRAAACSGCDPRLYHRFL